MVALAPSISRTTTESGSFTRDLAMYSTSSFIADIEFASFGVKPVKG
jgi:hypothetical protein